MTGTVLLLGLLSFMRHASDAADATGSDESDVLSCRVVALSPKVDDDQPDLTKGTDSFDGPSAVTLGIELKNVSSKPLTLLGVRYGDSYPTATGKLATDTFAPYLFTLEFTDPRGNPISRPKREYLESMLVLSGASVHELAPGQSLVVVLRPAQFRAPMNFDLEPGDYRVRVHYQGPSEGVIAQIKKHWPDKPHTRAWTGAVASNDIAFTILGKNAAVAKAEPKWGDPSDGLRAAVRFRPRTRSSQPGPIVGEVPVDTVIDVEFLVQNVSDKPVSLISETWRQDDQVSVKNEKGEDQQLGGSWYTGWPVMARWTLKPGEIATLAAANLGIASTDEVARKFEHPVGKTLVGGPGTYLFQYTIRLGNIQTQDDKGNVILPGKEDVQTTLVTAGAPLVVRKRSAEDDAAARAEMFVGQVEFVDENGRPVDHGTCVVRPVRAREAGKPIAIHPGSIEIADCTKESMYVDVLAHGYEHAIFYDVTLKPGEVKRLQLKPAMPARFRLISADDGKPVAGAMVRIFNKTSDKASSGPYPTEGLDGAIWATSGDDGTVLLDTLQRVDPYYATLGTAVYFFYVEAPGKAGQFVGPITSGRDLGDVKLSPPLEVNGTIRGTKEQLDHFTAEWDQPFTIKTSEPTAIFDYAVSKPLEVKREGDVLTFHLTDLRPGRLRIVANFDPPPQSVSHTFSRRDPKGSDVLYELELTASINDLVLEPKAPAR